MLYFARWKIIIIASISALAILFSLPNLFSASQLQSLPSWMQMRMPLGLDLQGGSHLLLQMNTNELVEDWLESTADDVRNTLRTERVGYTGLRQSNSEVRVTIRDAADYDRAFEKLGELAQPISNNLLGTSATDLVVERAEGNVVVLKPSEFALSERVTAAIGSAIETVRRRVDALGTTEPTIQRQGEDRIVLQVPGFRDPQKLKELVGQTAKLTFHLVDHSMSVSEAQTSRPPAGSEIYLPLDPGDPPELLRRRVLLSGEDLVEASAGFDQQTNEVIVSFRFNASGAQRFAKISSENVNRRFAIVLDDKVITAPNINEPILGGSGQISGNFTIETANNLAILLRSGALPASLNVIEERSVGASLGADSIAAGEIAAIIAFVAVTFFMIACYGLFGIFAVVALIVNISIILATLSLLQATLTLPGIAGIALTMGVAVDSSVLIFERIREEIRSGKSVIIGIEAGFSRAYSTIIDANLTGLLAGVILFWLGVGPVRGFAVTMCIGILASMFTAITLTRLLIVEWLRITRPQTVPI
jgi:protein-export membrane protein SecD